MKGPVYLKQKFKNQERPTLDFSTLRTRCILYSGAPQLSLFPWFMMRLRPACRAYPRFTVCCNTYGAADDPPSRFPFWIKFRAVDGYPLVVSDRIHPRSRPKTIALT